MGATYQEVEAVLELLEAIDVLCLCQPCGGRGEGSGLQITPDAPHSSPLTLSTHPPDTCLFSSPVYCSSSEWCLPGPPSAVPQIARCLPGCGSAPPRPQTAFGLEWTIRPTLEQPILPLPEPPCPSSAQGLAWPSWDPVSLENRKNWRPPFFQPQKARQAQTLCSYLVPGWVLGGWGPPWRRWREGTWFPATGLS